MNLQDQIDQFQKLVFANFRPSSNNECRIAALVPLVEETYAIYKFATSMLRAMHKRKDSMIYTIFSRPDHLSAVKTNRGFHVANSYLLTTSFNRH